MKTDVKTSRYIGLAAGTLLMTALPSGVCDTKIPLPNGGSQVAPQRLNINTDAEFRARNSSGGQVSFFTAECGSDDRVDASPGRLSGRSDKKPDATPNAKAVSL
jgi:hypothetical protein